MERIPSSPPQIATITASADHPLWSVMIPVYNCSNYLPEVLESVLLQDLGKDMMQIEVVDDASTDIDVEKFVLSYGKGRISYFRQDKNVGSLRNFETCINRANGKLIHLLHGDDKVKAGFYKKLGSLFEKFPEAGAAFSSYSFIDEFGNRTHDHPSEAKGDGILKDWLLRIAECQRIQYASMVVRRDVYEKLGSFYGMSYGEDWEMWVRIAKYYPVAYTPEVLAEYRGHVGSLSWQKAIEGKNALDVTRAMEIIQTHVPENKRKSILLKSKRHCAFFNIGMAYLLWKESGDRNKAKTLIKQALNLSKDPLVYYSILKFYIKITLKVY